MDLGAKAVRARPNSLEEQSHKKNSQTCCIWSLQMNADKGMWGKILQPWKKLKEMIGGNSTRSSHRTRNSECLVQLASIEILISGAFGKLLRRVLPHRKEQFALDKTLLQPYLTKFNTKTWKDQFPSNLSTSQNQAQGTVIHPACNMVKFTMYAIQSKMSTHAEKQKNIMNDEGKIQSIEMV